MTDSTQVTTPQMTVDQVRWARDHDWFIQCSKTITGKVCIIANDVYTINDVLETSKRVFTDFGELYAWAGY